MRVKYVLLVSLFIYYWSQVSYAQNLVPNPSFEDYIICPNGTNQLETCNYWQNFGNSPDYWNECSPPTCAIPNVPFGYQFAHSGSGMSGLTLFRRPNAPSGPNYREFIGVELLQSLTVGVKYYISFFINFSGHPTVAIACNNASLKFSTVAYDSCCPPAIDNIAFLTYDSILQDTTSWIKVSGTFIADSSYQFVMLGNFFDDSHTDTMLLGIIPDYSYYYFDDVCVTTDSIYNNTWTGISEFYSNTVVYPNPVSNIINIKSTSVITEVLLYNNLGQLLSRVENKIDGNLQKLDISQYRVGIYLILIRTKKGIIKQMIYKI